MGANVRGAAAETVVVDSRNHYSRIDGGTVGAKVEIAAARIEQLGVGNDSIGKEGQAVLGCLLRRVGFLADLQQRARVGVDDVIGHADR